MKVKELIERFNIKIYFKVESNVIKKYGEEEVLAYAYSDFGGAFIFKGARIYFAYMNGCRKHHIGPIIEIIKKSKFEKQVPPEELERYSILEGI